jgi:hypothetical protein
MIIHIFRKDLALLWPHVALTAAIQVLNAGFSLYAGPFARLNQGYMLTSFLLPFVAQLSLFVLTVAVVHQDSIPGLTQDWLSRPIRRRDLLLAKILFVVLAVLGPALFCDLALGCLSGLPAAAVLAASLLRTVALFALICLPGLIIGAITRSIWQVALVLLAAFVAFVASGTAADLLGISPAFNGTGLTWISTAAWTCLIVAAGAIVLPLQYGARRTALSRRVAGPALLGCALAVLLPWRAGFALQEALAAEPGAASAIGLRFDTTGRRSVTPLAALPGTVPRDIVRLPVTLTGLPGDGMVRIDHYTVRLFGADGALIYRDSSERLNILDMPFPREPVRSAGGTGQAAASLVIDVPDSVRERYGTQPLRLEIEAWATLLRPFAEARFRQPGETQLDAALGECTARGDENQNLTIACVSTQHKSGCISVYVQPAASANARVWHYANCDHVDYAPFIAGLWRDAYFHYQTAPVACGFGSALVIEDFSPRDHFTRRLVVDGLRLAGVATPPTPQPQPVPRP